MDFEFDSIPAALIDSVTEKCKLMQHDSSSRDRNLGRCVVGLDVIVETHGH